MAEGPPSTTCGGSLLSGHPSTLISASRLQRASSYGRDCKLGLSLRYSSSRFSSVPVSEGGGRDGGGKEREGGKRKEGGRERGREGERRGAGRREGIGREGGKGSLHAHQQRHGGCLMQVSNQFLLGSPRDCSLQPTGAAG